MKRVFPSACANALVALAALSVLTALPTNAAVNGVEEVGHSFQSQARGGVEMAMCDTAIAQVRNPAAAALQQHGRFDIKFSEYFLLNKWNGPLDGSLTSKKVSPSGNLGIIYPFSKKWGAGFAISSKGSGSNGFDNLYLLYPGGTPTQKTKVSLKFQDYEYVLNLAYRPTEKLYLGIGPRVEVATFNCSLVEGPLKLDWGKSTSVGAGFQIGTFYKLTPHINLGASYRSPTWMNPFATSKATLTTGGYSYRGSIGTTHYWMPARIGWGASWHNGEKFKLGVEAAYLNYTSSIFGGVNVRGLQYLKFNPSFRDIWIFNVGTDYQLNDKFTVSTGYCYNTCPTSRGAVTPQFVSSTQHMVTYGLRYTHRNKWWVGASHVFGMPNEINANGSTAVPVGVDYTNAHVRNMVQSFNCGLGFYF